MTSPLMVTDLQAIALWAGVVVMLFLRTTPRRALLAGLIGGWLFLPSLHFTITGALPDVSKANITSLGLLAAVLVFDARRLLALRPRWFDVPMAVWCAGPFLTALVNGESVYEGISAVSQNVFVWGIPYLFGRLYLQDREGWRELATAIFLGGLVYLPLCWIEIVVGPRLTTLVYGYIPASVWSSYRFGGWRPIVFMDHGLMVAMWMTAASVCGFWLWRTGILLRVWRVRTEILVALLLVTTLALRSVNAWVLLVTGIGLLFLSTRWRTPWLVWGTLALMLLYVGVRASGLWDGQQLVALTSSLIDNKTSSIEFRMDNEQLLAQRARVEPVLGWGRWGRAYVRNRSGKTITTADSLWIIVFGQQGLMGLVAVFAVLIVPIVFLMRRVPMEAWARIEYAPAAALAMVLLLYAIDGLANAMLNPVYVLAAGGLLTLSDVTMPAHETVMEHAPLAAQTHSP